MRKVFIILGLIILILAVVAFVVFRAFVNQFDQVRLQYDKEVKSKHKRDLDFTPYDLDDFHDYEKIHGLVKSATIEEIQNHLSNESFTCVELCQYYLMRIKNNQTYNAVIQLNPNLLEEARQVDEKIKNGQTGALFGVTVLVKDNISVVNMNTASGAYALKDLETKRDATIISSLKDQDALVMGKANLSEWSNFMSQPSSSGFSVLGGQTKNPYGKYDVGGSSSGSSVATALNLSTIAIGTETSGSLIFPAGQNSVVALKPTMGLLSRDLIIPISEAQDTAGVISRHVVDLNQVFNLMVKKDKNDEATHIVDDYEPHIDLRSDYLSDKRIGVIQTGTDEMNSLVEAFQALGVLVVEVELPSEAYTSDMMSVLKYGMKHDLNAFLSHEDVITSVKSLDDVIEFNQNDPSYMPFGQALLEGASAFESKDIQAIIDNNKFVTRQGIDQILEAYNLDALLSMSNQLSGVYAPAGYPAITLPAGYKSDGEPYGLTLVGSYLDDQKLINMAYAFEQNYNKRKVLD